MCGRARCTMRADDIPRACHRSDAPLRSVNMDRYRPSYNVSPGSNLPVVYRGGGPSGGDGYSIHCMTWGLIPNFTKKTEKPDFYKMFNARSESVGEKASFRRLLPKSRCLVAVEGFYEWKKDGSKKQPYYIHFRDGRSLVFAALYDSWQNAEGEILYTFTILTTSSSSALQWLHDRMPVVLGDKGAVDKWLDGSCSSKLDDVLKPYENSDLVWYPVTPAMGKTSFSGPECIKEIQVKTENKNTISKFFTRKEIKGEHESTLKESTADKSVNMDHPDTVKVEYKVEDPSTVTSDLNLKSDVSTIPHENATKRETPDPDSKSSVSKSHHDDEAVCPTKRPHEEPLAQTELNTDEDAKRQQSPLRKKAHLKTASDKQPTLLSYFSKR